MINGLRNSISNSLEYISKANRNVEKFSRQLATGKKVASVKDDGASYIRANNLQNLSKMNQIQADWIGYYNQMTSMSSNSAEQTISLLGDMRTIALEALSAKQAGKSTTDHEARLGQIAVAIEDLTDLSLIDTNFTFISDTSADSEFALNYYGGRYYQDSFVGSGMTVQNTNNVTGTFDIISSEYQFTDNTPIAAQYVSMTRNSNAGLPFNFAVQLASVASIQGFVGYIDKETHLLSLGNQRAGFTYSTNETTIEKSIEISERYLQNASSITDIDLSFVSSRLNEAQNKLSIAQATIAAAIGHYQSYAGGLLANITSTQNAIIA